MANQFIKNIVSQAAQEAKEIAIETLKTQDTDALKQLVDAELAKIIEPLEDEIKITNSWWVKVRNRMYITILKKSTSNIVKAIQQKLLTL